MRNLLFIILLFLTTALSAQTVGEYNFLAAATPAGAGTYGMNGFFLDTDGRGFTTADITIDVTHFFDSNGQKFIIRAKTGTSPIQLDVDAVGHANSPVSGLGQISDLSPNGMPYTSGGVSGKVSSTVNNEAIAVIDAQLGTGGGAVDSVNGNTGTVVLDPDDLNDAATTNKFTTAGDISKLAGIETGATADQSDAEIETAYNSQVSAASQVEMEAGTETAIRRMSPLRIAQAIAALSAGLTSSVNPAGGQSLYKLEGTATANELTDVLSGDLVPIANNVKRTGIITLPAGIPDPGFAITATNAGFNTPIDKLEDFRDSFLIKGKAYYVDPVFGNDLNLGTNKATPLKTIAGAATKTDLGTLYLKGGFHVGDLGTIDPTSDTIAILPYDGNPIVGALIDEQTWTTSSMTNVYKTTFTGTSPSFILDPSSVGDLGQFLQMESVSDTALLENNPGSWRVQGLELFLHVPSGEQPSYSNFIGVNTAPNDFGVGTHRYVEGLDFYGPVSSVSSGNSNTYIANCGFFYSANTDHVYIEGDTTDQIIFNDCQIYYSYQDAFNYEAGINAVEMNCKGRYAGWDDSAGRAQVSTAHDSTSIIRINNEYFGGSDETVYDVNSRGSVAIGGTYENEWRNTSGDSFCIGHSGVMYLIGVKVGGNSTYDIGGDGSTTIYVRDMGINSTTRVESGTTLIKF